MACTNSINPNSGKDLLIQIGNNFAASTVAADTTTETFTYTAHGLSDDDPISFSSIGTITGISINTKYYIVGATANTFQVALTRGGAAIALGGTNSNVTAVETYDDITGLTSTTISEAATIQEITNKSSNNFREILDQAGIKSMTVSGNGISSNDWAGNKLRTIFLAQALRSYRIFIVPTDASTLRYWEGCFKIASMELTGELDASQQFSLTLESANAFAFYEV